jgi:hypothetical protein
MKNAILFSVLALMTSMAHAQDCTSSLSEEYNLREIRVQKVTLLFDSGARAIYQIRGNDHGGDFMDEAIVVSGTCKIVETYNIWSE